MVLSTAWIRLSRACLPSKPERFIGPDRDKAVALMHRAQRLKETHGNARLLLCGQPGVGKTRRAEMLARALCPQYSLVEDIHGHRVRKMAHPADMPIRKLSPIEQLIILRHRKQWTQTVAARKLRVPVRTLRSWEEKTRRPKPIVLHAIQAFVDANAAE